MEICGDCKRNRGGRDTLRFLECQLQFRSSEAWSYLIYLSGRIYEHISTTTEFGGSQTIHCSEYHWDTSSGTSTTHWSTVNQSTGKYSCCGADDPNANIVTWKKYNAVETRTYGPVEGPFNTSGGRGSVPSFGVSTYSSYTVNDANGFSGSGGYTSTTVNSSSTLSGLKTALEGRWEISSAWGSDGQLYIEATRYDTIESLSTGAIQSFSWQGIEYRRKVLSTTYSQGTSLYGTVTTELNQVPSGTVVQGSYAEGYVVIKSGSTYYYYKKS